MSRLASLLKPQLHSQSHQPSQPIRHLYSITKVNSNSSNNSSCYLNSGSQLTSNSHLNSNKHIINKPHIHSNLSRSFASSTIPKLKITPTGAALGATIEGLAFEAEGTEEPQVHHQQVDILREALLNYGVLIFHGLKLDEEHLLGFTSVFGEPQEHKR